MLPRASRTVLVLVLAVVAAFAVVLVGRFDTELGGFEPFGTAAAADVEHWAATDGNASLTAGTVADVIAVTESSTSGLELSGDSARRSSASQPPTSVVSLDVAPSPIPLDAATVVSLQRCATPRQRLQCVRNTFVTFPDDTCSQYGCRSVHVAPDGDRPAMPCCMHRMPAKEARDMLHGAHVVMVGDSVARRVGRHISAYLTDSQFEDQKGTTQFHTPTTNVSLYWVPAAAHKPGDFIVKGVQSGQLARDVCKVVVVMMSSHDIAEWWAEKTEPAQQRWVVDPVTLVKGWVDAVVTSLADAVAALQLTSQDMLLVRDPLAQGCTSAYYPDLCRYVLVGAVAEGGDAWNGGTAAPCLKP